MHCCKRYTHASGSDALDDDVRIAQVEFATEFVKADRVSEIALVCDDDDGLVADFLEFSAKLSELVGRGGDQWCGRVGNEDDDVAPSQEFVAAINEVALCRNIDDFYVDGLPGMFAVGVRTPIERAGESTFLGGHSGCFSERSGHGVGHGGLSSKWRTVEHDSNRDGLLSRW